MKNSEEQLILIKRGAVEIIQEKELKVKLAKGKPLVIKAGFDPTAPDIHLGHTVLLRKMRHFQELGHEVVFLIGDYTAMIGDPSGESKTRPRLTGEEAAKNAETYKKQISKILDIKKLKVRFNSEWLDKMTARDVAALMSNYSVQRTLERDDFANRYKQQKTITMLEFLYPLLQGYDSVALKADIELGGTDQKFNLLVGRDIQRAYGQESQVVITMPLLEGLDGVQKMSKSLGNYVGINEPAKEIFGKLMSISDELMYKYYELLTDEDVEVIKKDVTSGKLHPKGAKSNLAKSIVAQYYDSAQAGKEEEDFERVFKQKELPKDIPWFEVGKEEKTLPHIMLDSGMAASASAAKRLIEQGGVTIDGKKVSDPNIKPKEGVIKVGRKFIKLLLKKK
ncbi:MAG: tyrosine--tRNA ligase [Candidatus Omnitrophica bacterium]|nr:tyrosine--tRNA ligase [Candidatus Omnitrophota bacterium]MCG2705341.1 tyrosine--tRNA ligase [Candidatus Omnitrophota bacterium]